MPRLPVALCCLALLLGLAAPALADECAAWPGEPFPLPSVQDPNPSYARWARLRAEELALHAEQAEASQPSEALRLWRRVLCLDPKHAAAWQGVARTRSVHVHRPQARWGRRRGTPGGDPWLLAADLRVPVPPPPLTPEQREALGKAEELVEASELHLAAARFQQAIGEARAAHAALAGITSGRTAPRLRVRADVAAATAQVALGDTESARASFGRALEADPRLRLDPASTSPKVIEALEAVRTNPGGAP